MIWRKLFFKNINTYIGLINQYLSKKYDSQPLSNYFKIIGGYAFKSKEYKQEGIPVIRISDFQNEKIVLDKVKYYEESEDLKKYELYEGDIIIAMTGGTIGKLAIVQKDLGKLYLNQRVGKFELKDNSLFYDKYVYWIARGVEEKVKSLAWGGAQPNISSKKIEEMKFPVPTRDVQLKIVNFLSDFEKNQLKNNVYFNEQIESQILKIHKQCINIASFNNEIQTQKQLISELKQSILQEAIQGKLTAAWRKQNPNVEPASELLKRIKAEKAQLIKDKKIKKGKKQASNDLGEIQFDIPTTWVYSDLDDITQFTTDGTHQTPTYTETGRIFLSAQNVKPFKFMPENHRYISEQAYEEYTKGKLPEVGDLLIGRVGSKGETAVIDQDIEFAYYVSLGFVKTFKSLTNPDYLAIVMNSPYGNKYATGNMSSIGASAGNYNLGRIRSFPIPFPPLDEQLEIVNKVNDLMETVEALESEITQSEQHANMLMQAVLKEAFEGKKKIED